MDVGKPSKKIIIRKFKPRLKNHNFDLNWEILHDSIIKIQKKQKALTTCEDLYSLVEKLCRENYAGEMYNRLLVLISNSAKNGYEEIYKISQNFSVQIFLERLNNLWESFCQQMNLVRNIFLYMDRTYRVQNTQIISLWDSGLDAFRSCVISNKDIKYRTVKGILSLIEFERNGITVDRQLIKSLLRMFMSLQIYDNVFEPEFLKATQRMYEQESKVKLQELEISHYLIHVSKRLNEETERLLIYLDSSTAKKLINVTETCFIMNYLNLIINKGTDTLLSLKKNDDLGLLYNLLSRVKNGQNTFKTAFSEYIKKIGRTLISDTSRDKFLVQDLMNFKTDLDEIILKCFDNNEKFIQAEKDSFDYFINTRPNRPAELIAKFMDSKLRTGNKECSEEELDAVMDKVILLFRFIQGKDVFEAFYKKDLAKRLLLGRSASVDAEKAMLFKLTHECGAGFTQKLEGMFKDMEISREFCNAFKQNVEANDRDGNFSKVEIGVNILTMGHWPTYPIMEVNIPPQLSQLQLICGNFYASKHNGRKLHWQYSLASAILKATFKPTILKEMDVSLFQAIVLLMFNNKIEFSYEEILIESKIEETELKRTLQSLACGKFRVLRKDPKGKEVESTDNFLFNEDFNDRLYRIRISQVQMRETEAEHQQTEEQIFQDRQYQIDAAIVRVMKTRKEISHNLLMTELLNQLRFASKPTDLKKRIESLIDREYMSRDKNDAQLYHYVA